ncbi:hypothetical protein SAMN02745729_1067 [Marinobacterium iners DSM 11526]|uniref:Uncharacterized protein n=1 Tax=Marinobacterium iners DSM 11526 TaxID=1122198 RepID=A0A1H4D9I6_9GAMM|nr:hypothetical protein SAMN02745729_1067 [Marinobacterium iners DSM 11526]
MRRRNAIEAYVAVVQEGRFQSEPSGKLRITCAITFGERFLAPQFNDFMSNARNQPRPVPDQPPDGSDYRRL